MNFSGPTPLKLRGASRFLSSIRQALGPSVAFPPSEGGLVIGLLSHYVIGYDISSPYNQAVSGYLPSRQEKLWHKILAKVKPRQKSVHFPICSSAQLRNELTNR